MNRTLIGNFFIQDGMIRSSEEFVDFSCRDGIFIYEVLRVDSGVPLFVKEHLIRLRKSIDSVKLKCPVKPKKVEEDLCMLINSNGMKTGNIMLMFCFAGSQVNYRFYQIPHNYPSEQDYLKGVEVGLLYAERVNPIAKTVQPDVREKANELIAKNNYYEVLLVDNDGYIREGSRSNVFFIKGNTFYSPPEEKVLNGITRQKAIEIIKTLGIDLREESVRLGNIGNYDSIFLTGTSPKILPVSNIEGYTYDPENQLCKLIRLAFDEMITRYISDKL